MKTRSDILYQAAPYGLIAVIPRGTPVVEAKNLPGRTGPRYWALPWEAMGDAESAWMRNYGFLLQSAEVEDRVGKNKTNDISASS